jgi:hydroxymethylpyrimidine pyrophosphatase-like HAD family hydrolase
VKPAYYLTDLDGTLLQSDATLSSFTIHSLTEAIKSGTIISYATARSLIITYNGLLDELEKIHTYISDLFGNQVHSRE